MMCQLVKSMERTSRPPGSDGSDGNLHEKSERLTLATVYALAILAPQILGERW